VNVETELSPLAAEAHRGNRAALDELLGRLRPEVVRVTRLVLGAGSWIAEDAAQEALLDIARNIGSLRDPAAVRAWALRTATNRALKAGRLERLRPRRLDDVDVVAHAPPDASFAELRDAFYRLPPRMRAVAVLRLYVGLSEAETSQVLGCSVGTVKSQLHEARSRLAAFLEEER
jgi:RNA polymerase sigma factor (sigma-70 family)